MSVEHTHIQFSYRPHSQISIPFINALMEDRDLEGELQMHGYFVLDARVFHLLSDEDEELFFIVRVGREGDDLWSEGPEEEMIQAFNDMLEEYREEVEIFNEFELRHSALHFEYSEE